MMARLRARENGAAGDASPIEVQSREFCSDSANFRRRAEFSCNQVLAASPGLADVCPTQYRSAVSIPNERKSHWRPRTCCRRQILIGAHHRFFKRRIQIGSPE